MTSPTPAVCPDCHRLACTCDSGVSFAVLFGAAFLVLLVLAGLALAWIER